MKGIHAPSSAVREGPMCSVPSWRGFVGLGRIGMERRPISVLEDEPGRAPGRVGIACDVVRRSGSTPASSAESSAWWHATGFEYRTTVMSRDSSTLLLSATSH
jgi:hypothetical protein